MRFNAAAVILSHNHPSFNCEPSRADKDITLRLKKALVLVAGHVLDHITVTGNETLLMAARGLLSA